MNMRISRACTHDTCIHVQLHIHTLDVSKCESCSFALEVQTTKVRADTFIELLNFWETTTSQGRDWQSERVSSLKFTEVPPKDSVSRELYYIIINLSFLP